MNDQGTLFDEPVMCGRCKKPEPREWCWEGRTTDCPLGYGPRYYGTEKANARRYQPIPIQVDRANARKTDPITSKEAAASIRSDAIRRSQAAILGMLKRYGPMYDQQLIDRYLYYQTLNGGDVDVPPQSESGIRTRRSELVAKGLVEDSGEKTLLTSGRRTIIWRAT
jgi:hypothetical protein